MSVDNGDNGFVLQFMFWRSTDEILIILDQKSFIWWSDLFGKYFVFSFINFVFVFVFVFFVNATENSVRDDFCMGIILLSHNWGFYL